jgi:L-fuconolactonase
VIVDAHHHLWDPGRRDYPWMSGATLDPIRRPYTVDDLRAAAGPDVTATVLVQTVSSVAETEEFLAVADASDGLIVGVVGWVDLTAPADLERLRTVPGGHLLVGIRHQVEDEPDLEWLLRTEVQQGLRAVGAAGLVYDVLVRAPQRAAAYTAAKQLPDVPFVVDHAGKPGIATGEWEAWAAWIANIAELPNVTCKLSGLITEAVWDSWSAEVVRPYAEHVLSSFGPDRVMFGSDWPVCELAGSYAEVLDLARTLLAGAPEAFGETARRTYSIS